MLMVDRNIGSEQALLRADGAELEIFTWRRRLVPNLTKTEVSNKR
jgi:hypothetical protein